MRCERKLGRAISKKLAGFFVLFAISIGCGSSAPPQSSESNNQKLKNSQAEPKKTEGGKYPPVAPDLTKPLNVEEKPVIVPTGPKRGNMEPENKKNKAEPGAGQLEPKRVEGGKYPAVKQDLRRPLNEEANPQTVPTGPERSKVNPDRKP